MSQSPFVTPLYVFSRLTRASVRAFAAAVVAKYTTGIDVLINNAGIMALPLRTTTVDGFESQVHATVINGKSICFHNGNSKSLQTIIRFTTQEQYRFASRVSATFKCF